MNPVRRLLYELSNLFRILCLADAVRLSAMLVWHGPAIVRTRRLTALDRAMSRPLRLWVHGAMLLVPAGAMDAAAEIVHSRTFGIVREMYANDVYLRAFRPAMRCAVVVDLGSNRGLFSLLALRVLGAELVLEVEPQAHLSAVRDLLLTANEIPPERVHRYERKVGPRRLEQLEPEAAVSIETLLQTHRLTQIDFLKIDIEGAEEQLFADAGWLPCVRNLAMELHPAVMDAAAVLRAVEASGMQVRLTDQFGRLAPIEHAMFLYASRVGCLR